MLLIILLVLVSLFVLFQLGVYFIGNRWLSTPPYQGAVSDHFNGKTFFHPWQLPKDGGVKGFGAVLKWQMDRRRERGVWKFVNNTPAPKPPERVMGDELRVTFINHSTVLIQTEGINIITDPVYGERVSPFSFMGPKRHKNPGIRFEDLPKIDIILLSHNHYDHSDEPTLIKLTKRDAPLVITSLGVPLYLQKIGITNVIELDWWQEYSVREGLNIHAVPAQHFSSRGTVDRNTSLWSGFVIAATKGNIYFAADTGYAPIFKQIGEKFSEMRLSLIPIGAYKPRWFMSGVHVDPDDAVRIHQDVRSKQSIGIHWGTFKLTDEGMDDPAKDLFTALADAKVDPAEFIAIAEGSSWENRST